MADQGENQPDQMVAEFAGITGVDENRARFYLQSANWDLNIGLETFYDQSAEADPLIPDMEDVVEQENPEAVQSAPPAPQPAAPPAARTKPNSNIFSLSSYQGDEDKSDSEEGQAFYAGGSEHSGQQILGPDKPKKSNPTGDLFDAAKKHGAAVVSEEESGASKPNKTYFRGAGYKLGSDVEPSQQVTPSLGNNTAATSDKPSTVVVKFWRNGFSIDDGPLRDFNDPANKNFLDSISKGEVPAELRALVRNSEVHVNMEDHREEEYVKPKQRTHMFSGKGQMLGSPTPNILQTSAAATPPPATATGTSQASAFQVDESKPVTTLQIRLADGTRLVSKFNHESTVGDVRNVVRSARPNTGNFNLMTTFPNKILSEDDVSLTDAKLLNAVIVQRMT